MNTKHAIVMPRVFVRWAYIPAERRACVADLLRLNAETLRTNSKGEADDNAARDLHAAADALETAGNLAVAANALRMMRPAPPPPPEN